MIKAIFYKILLSSLAILILVSTSSFAVEKHFCKGSLIDLSVFNTLEKCSNAPCSDNTKGEDLVDAKCCNDVVDILEGQDVFQTKSLDDLKYSQKAFLLAFSVSLVDLFSATPVQNIPHKDYHSPIIITNKLVRHQLFLI